MLPDAEFHLTKQGRKVGLLRNRPEWPEVVGGSHALYTQGCDIVVLFNPAYGPQQIRKFTISGKSVAVGALLEALNRYESGWGGRAEIIGSLLTGSQLSIETAMEIIIDSL